MGPILELLSPPSDMPFGAMKVLLSLIKVYLIVPTLLDLDDEI